MSYASNYDVPPEVSPFVPLPLLDRCGHCGEPITWVERFAVMRDDGYHCPLCAECAA